MRVTHNLMFKTGSSAMQAQQQDILKVQESSLTGNRTNRPSDDPTGIYRHMLFSADLTGVQSLKKTTEFASQRLTLADSHVNQVHERMLESKDLALKMANSHVGGNPEIMKATAEDAEAIYLDILKSVNSEIDEIPIFGGSRTRLPYDSKNLNATAVQVRSNGKGPMAPAPAGITASVADNHSVTDLPVSVKVTYLASSGQFDVDVNGIRNPQPTAPTGTPPVLNIGNGISMTLGSNPAPGDVYYFEVVPKYQGGAADRPVKVLNGQTLPGNLNAQELLEGTGSVGRNVNVLGAVAALRGALLRADPDEVSFLLDRLQEGRAQVSDLQAVTGVRVTQVDAVGKTLEIDELALEEAKATNIEADILGVMSSLEQATQAMQVMTITERQVLNTSLIDFIR
ncbi:MAG: hypothetical protein HQL81_10140 [Magnetococcales bacterium]|nr:hypothetical protein [Magnetococcales bacterium]